jgi:hypothetical protein
MSAASAPSPARIAPIALWRVAQAFLNTLYNLFGAPEDVAFQHTYTAKAHRQLAQWLRCAEAMLRRLLLIEASAYAGAANASAPHQQKRQRVRKLHEFTHDKPEAWRVSFRCFAFPLLRQAQHDAGGDAAGLSKAKRPDRQRFRSAWPLAERYEAILRVFNDPTPYAQRLSRRLRATPKRLHEILRAPPEAEHRIDGFEALTHQAESAWRPHFSSA